MRTGIIGLPQVGKTSLFKILTKARLDAHAVHSRDAHVGIARVPDERLDKLSALFHPKKTTHATVEYVDVAAIGEKALKEAAYAQRLREVDSLTHVLRAFEDPAIPLDAGSEAHARSKGTLRLEGKDYIVKDGDVMHIRHSA